MSKAAPSIHRLWRPRLWTRLLVAVLVAASLSVATEALLVHQSATEALRAVESQRAAENRSDSLRLLMQRGMQQLALLESWANDSRTESALRRGDSGWFITNAAQKLVGVSGINALKMYDRDGLLSGSAGDLLAATDLWESPPALAARQGMATTALVTNLDGLWIVAAAPVLGGDLAPPSDGILVSASRIDGTVARLLADGSGDGIAFVAASKVLAASDADVARELSETLVPEPPQGGGVVRGATLDLSLAPLSSEAGPFFGADPGTLLVVASSREVYADAQARLVRDALVALVVALALAVLTAAVFARRLGGPLRSLLEALHATGHGDLGRTAPIRGHDEFADLTRAFNEMSLRLAAAHEALRHAATRDSSTGLLNHREFFRRLSAELARADREERRVSVLMIDIDNFKRVNDERGHLVGDALLLRIARIVSGNAREADVVARYGGDEFAVALLGVDAPEAVRIAERLRCLAATPGESSLGAGLTCTLSVGVATRQAWCSSAQQLVEAADHALLAAKRVGRDCVVADPERVPPPASGTSV